jgi:lanosterol synthase
MSKSLGVQKVDGIDSFTHKLVSKERMCDAIDLIISMQNDDGGFPSYEKARGPKWVEWLNCAEVFG